MRHLPAVEALGSVSVIATDKTGTITEGRMVAQRVWTPLGEAAISGTGYGLDGDVIRDAGVVRASDATDLSALLQAAALVHRRTVQPPDPEHPEGQVLGDPTEAALIVAAEKLGLGTAALSRRIPAGGRVSLRQLRKRMTTVHRQPTGYLVSARALRSSCCTAMSISAEDAVLSEPPSPRHMSTQGWDLRVLAVAVSGISAPTGFGRRRPKATCSCWAWSALQIRLRPSAPATIAAFRTAGITPILITGDHPGYGGGDCDTGRYRHRARPGGRRTSDRVRVIKISCCLRRSWRAPLPNRKWPSSMPDGQPAKSSP